MQVAGKMVDLEGATTFQKLIFSQRNNFENFKTTIFDDVNVDLSWCFGIIWIEEAVVINKRLRNNIEKVGFTQNETISHRNWLLKLLNFFPIMIVFVGSPGSRGFYGTRRTKSSESTCLK